MLASPIEPLITWQRLDPHALFALDLPDLHPIVAVTADLDPLEQPELASRWLGDATRAHVGTWRSPVRRRHFLAGRVAARIAAHLALDVPLDACAVTTSDAGAPRIVWDDTPHPASITHSGRHALATLSPDHWLVGLDYEVGAGERPHLARRVCGEAERARFALDAPDAGPRFERIWVLKEALLKAWEVGLVAQLDHFSVRTITPEGRVTFDAHAPLHPHIPYPFPTTLLAAVGTFEGHPLAIAVVPRPDGVG